MKKLLPILLTLTIIFVVTGCEYFEDYEPDDPFDMTIIFDTPYIPEYGEFETKIFIEARNKDGESIDLDRLEINITVDNITTTDVSVNDFMLNIPNYALPGRFRLIVECVSQNDVSYEKERIVEIDHGIPDYKINVGQISISGSLDFLYSFPWSDTYAYYRKDYLEEDRYYNNKLDDSCMSVDTEPPDTDEYIIRYDNDEELEKIKQNFEVLDTLPVLNAALVKKGDYFIATHDFKIEENSSYELQTYVDDYIKLPDLYENHWFQIQWNLKQIKMPLAWETTTGCTSVRIAVIDTGVHLDHGDFCESNFDVKNAFNFVEGSRDVSDFLNHGTHVTGIIAMNGWGFSGVMWDCTILPLKVSDWGSAETWDICKAMLYSAGLLDDPNIPNNPNPVDIINLSFGGSYSELMDDTISKVSNEGVLIVASAGNSSGVGVSFPAAFDEVVGVGATDCNSPNTPGRAYYSSYGDGLDIMAPGGRDYMYTNSSSKADIIYSTIPPLKEGTSTWRGFIGTSVSAPHISGVIGLMLANGIHRREIKDTLYRTAYKIGDSFEFGNGLVNAHWAVNDVKKIKIIAGEKGYGTIKGYAETEIGINDSSFELNGLGDGKHEVFAWVDVKDNDKLEPGDYLGKTTIEIKDNKHIGTITLEEWGVIN